ncbi:hypothetical protein J3R30DRAFT_3512346 [Lentinula aciculospora]|uniref:Uncharacterized protein n=1 Tax=Lentinula aciculospora TaxID=153920 RepID=A0A9W9A3U8_9AGAR|nr:hypothetical protein J3R30DRAFT_3512346 [Lentinula aciculospora]
MEGKHISEHTDFAQLRMTLASKFQRLQGVTRDSPPFEVYKSEVLLRNTMKEAGEIFRDAVKVIPCDVNTSGRSILSRMVWISGLLPSDLRDLLTNDKGKAKL